MSRSDGVKAAATMPDEPGARMPTICGNWAALWHRHGVASIDQKSDSRALRTLARCSALFVQRRVGTGSGLQDYSWSVTLGALELAVFMTCPVDIFAGAKTTPSSKRLQDRSVAYIKALSRAAVATRDNLLRCLQAVNTAHSLGGWPDVARSGAINTQKNTTRSKNGRRI